VFASGFVGLFLTANLLGPIVLGECYPFSIAPMFCEQPTCYCSYEVLDADGRSLPPERFGLIRVYDGNPVGLGCGIRPPETIDRFGAVPTAEEITDQVRSRGEAWQGLERITVKVRVVGDLEGRTVGIDESRSFEVVVAAPEGAS